MRSVLAILFLLIYFIVSLPIMLLWLLIGVFHRGLRDKFSLRYVQFGLNGILFFAGIKITTNGFENIPTDRAVMYVGNHITYFDVIATYVLWKNPTGYISKKEVRKIPIVNLLMYFANCLFLDRDDARKGLKMVLHAVELIEKGISIVIFPEGTRSKSGKLLDFKEGSFKIATKSKCPVVPMGITWEPDIFEHHMPWIKPAHVTINFGKPIETSEMSRQELKQLSSIAHAEVARLSGQE